MKKEYNIKQKVWIHLGERSLVEGRVVEIIDLVHLKEGHTEDNELYIIEIETSIDPIYEVRSWEQISPEAKGPINLFRKIQKETKEVNRFLKKVGIVLPESTFNPTDNPEDFVYDDDGNHVDEPTPEQIHAAMDRAEKANQDKFVVAEVKPKKRTFPPRGKAAAKKPRRPAV